MFLTVIYAAMVVLGLCALAAVALVLRSKDALSRAVVSDLVFYTLIGLYVLWSMTHETQIAYDVLLLVAIIGGVLPTMSAARIISKGRR
ncbi:cation:proton antiporter [Corynebacterium gerontici]|uniref:Putative monovalent cation/H+ antiporter subunit F n=1 Tax=Corynebacterium gerontici TaxID=2079234 RepID=A0A3G6J8F0_9CORY|nr:cation:proton antiporter [Corynebacterium gerontici]AZA12304.1 putative monovalent cation/H+ antiporter subunit F [Corynebacterium gerontici]